MTRSPAVPRKYDIRVVDRFYARCRARAEIERHRESLLRSWHATRRIMWTIVVGSTVVYLYLLDKVQQATSLL